MKVGALTTVDQILSSASNALLVFAVAQISPAEQFGRVALLITFATIWLGFNRGALGTPILLASDGDRRDIAMEAGYAASWAIVTGFVAGGMLLGIGWWLNIAWMGLAIAIGTVIALVQDVFRFCAIAQGQPELAVTCDGIWVVWMVVVFAFNLLASGLSLENTVYFWALGGLVSGVVLATLLGVVIRVKNIGRWWTQYRSARLRFGFVYATNQVGATLITIIATLVIGSVGAAGLRGAATLFGPIAMLISALPLVFLPHARTTGSGLNDQWRLLVKTSMLISAMTVLAALCLVLLPDAVGHALLGDTWLHARRLIMAVGAECAAMCWIVSIYSFLQSLGMSRAVFWFKIFQFAVQLAVSLAAGMLFGSVFAMAVALAICGWITVGAGFVVVQATIRRRSPSRVPSRCDGAAAMAKPTGRHRAAAALPADLIDMRSQHHGRGRPAPWPAIVVLEHGSDYRNRARRTATVAVGPRAIAGRHRVS